MSHDALFVLRHHGRETFHYDRWAALQIDRLLLTGPQEVADYIAALHRTDAPVTVPWLCGAVLLDLDRRELLYWADQFFGREAALHRYYRALLRERWPGYTTRFAMHPLHDFAAALGQAPPELAEARRRATALPPEQLVGLFNGCWQTFCADFADRPDELSSWIAERGEAEVRAAAEWHCDGWVTLRAADGTLHDQCAEIWAHESLLRAGPALVQLAREPRPDLPWPGFEGSVRETIFIDEAARTVHSWQGAPAWMNPAAFCGPLWPGWTLLPDPGGPRTHSERGGRPFAALRTPPDEAYTWLTTQLERCLGKDFAPQVWLAREATRLASEQPNTHVHIHNPASSERPVGAGVVDDPLRAHLAALIDEVDAD